MQDILDVLAAPKGTAYHFRYEDKYVDASVRGQDLTGLDALVHFSIQQEAKYHDAAFIPIRRGRVIEATWEAGIFIVKFELGDYVSLVPNDPTGRNDPTDLRRAVVAYTAALGNEEVPRPYDASLSIGWDARDGSSIFDREADDATAFRSTAALLQRTEWFRNARFVRFLSLRDGEDEVNLRKGSFRLLAGRTSELSLSHHDPGAGVTEPEAFAVDVDREVVEVIGRPGFDIASRYDVIRIALHAIRGQGNEDRETVVAIRPEEGVQGPTIRLPVTVYVSRRRALGLLVASALVLFVFGLPAVFTSWPTGIKFVLVVAGALGVSVLQNLGWSISVPGGFGLPTGGVGSGQAKTDPSAPSVHHEA